MATEFKPATPASQPATPAQIATLITRLGRIVNTSAVYGRSHKLTQSAILDGHAFLVQLLSGCRRVNLGLVEGTLNADGKPVDPKTPLCGALTARLADLRITGFSLLQGMPEAEFAKLIELLLTLSPGAPEGAFAEAVVEANLQFIEPERVVYKRVSETDAPSEAKDGGAGGAPAATGKAEADTGKATAAAVEQILAFLKGNEGTVTPEISEAVQKVASDAEKLANLILEAAAVLQRPAAVESGESLADLVVGCLRRTFDGLKQQPSARTQEGKKGIRKALLMIEKTVLDKLHGMIGPGDIEAAKEAIAAATEEMHDELEVASLASEYVRRRDSLQKTERRMVRYMKAQDERRQDDSPLYGQLSAAGLTPDGWHELVTKSTPPDSGKGSGSDRGSAGPPPELGVLAVLLSELDNLMKSGGTGGAGQAVQVAGKIDQEVGKLADGTRRKIEALGQVSQAEPPSTGPAGKKGRDQSRRDELLTEIVQELCQPASVINCCVDMLAGGYMGPLADEQKTILTTAASSGIRLESLLSRLREVIGVPAGLTPNREILG